MASVALRQEPPATLRQEATAAGNRARKLGSPEAGASPRPDDARLLRVAVVAATRLYRDGVAALLERHPRLLLVACDAGGPGAAARLERMPVDVVLLDMSSADSLATARVLATTNPQARVVALAAPGDGRHRAAYTALGIAACIPREAALEDVVTTLARMVDHDDDVTSSLAAGADGRRRQLTSRELEVVLLINEGLSNQEIADALGIAVATVKNHVHHALEKLRLRRRGEAAAWLRAGGASPSSPA